MLRREDYCLSNTGKVEDIQLGKQYLLTAMHYASKVFRLISLNTQGHRCFFNINSIIFRNLADFYNTETHSNEQSDFCDKQMPHQKLCLH